MGRKRHRHHHNHQPGRTTWDSLQMQGALLKRHVLMAQALGFRAETIEDEHRRALGGQGLLMLEWVEDLYFTRFRTCSPVDEMATPEAQQEHPAENSLLLDRDEIMNDFFREHAIVPGSDDEPD